MAEKAVQTTQRLLANIDEWVAKGAQAARLKAIDVVLEAAEGITEGSPVDTGYFRASWSVLLGKEPAMKATDRPKDWKELAGGAAKAQAIAEITTTAIGLQLGQTAWLFNPTVYGPRLEGGHSAQAPLGIVSVTVANLRVKYA